MPDTNAVVQARSFLRGEQLLFAEATALWKRLKTEDELSLARQVVQRMRREPQSISDGVPSDAATRNKLGQQHALLTSKDPELDRATRHDEALSLLAERFDYVKNGRSSDEGGSVERSETLGIAGGICKRRWNDLGQMKDLLQAAEFYQRGAKCEMGDDGYSHINAACVEDLLASAGDQPDERRKRANDLRKEILEKLEPSGTWFNAATRAEAFFGLKQYDQATEVLRRIAPDTKPDPWELRTMAEQHALLAYLHEPRPLQVDKIRTFFETLLPGAVDAIRGLMIGKVGLALSGGLPRVAG
jgi:hypothetical protein